jgi:hypothetical protein
VARDRQRVGPLGRISARTGDADWALEPRRVPAWLSKWIAGESAVNFMTVSTQTSNARFRRDFSWSPKFPGYREAFDEIHLAVSLVHGLAHSRLGIGLNAAQEIFVGAVITALPLVAGYLLWKNKLRAGGALLAASMAGALVFGAFYPFHRTGHRQCELPRPDWLGKLEDDQTAADLAGLELLGTILGLILVLKSYRKVV